MRKNPTLTALAMVAALGAAISAAPARAQVAGNPADQHTPTPYTAGQWSSQPAAPANRDSVNPFAPLGALAAGFSAPTATAASQTGCRAWQDFNGRYSAVCGP